MGFREDKEERKEHFLKYVYGWKQRPCSACNGSGYYDTNGSPKCSSCEGTGKEKYKPTKTDLQLLRINKKIAWHKRALKYWGLELQKVENKE